MATNPYFTQYHTQRFSFIGSPQQRDGTASRDQRFLNMYPELITSPVSDGKKYYLKKRPGIATFQTMGGAGNNGRGIFYWAANNTYYYVIGTALFANTTFLGSITSPSGPVGFCEFKTDSANLLFMADGQNGWTIDGGNHVTLVTDPNFPTPHIPNPIFLDGYIFVAHATTQTVHNSGLGTPLVWPSDGFIDAEMFPDNLVALAKVQNYLACVGQTSIEWFYDNANATGSPLQRNAPAVSQFGCPAPQTVNQTEKELILVGQTSNGGRTIWVIDGFAPTEIANAPVRQALDAESGAISTATAFTIQCCGHKWYVLNLKGNQRTFVYDFEEKMWHEWSSGLTQQCFQYDYAADSGSGAPILLSTSSNTSVSLSPLNKQDNGVSINCQVVTVKVDFDTIKRKRFYRLSLTADIPVSNQTGPVPMTVEWSDDDYTTWQSAGSTMNLNATYPTLMQLGYSRRRAFRFTYQQPYDLRMESFELDIIQEVRR